MRARTTLTLAVGVLFAIRGDPARAQGDGPPPTPVRPVVDTLFGRVVVDPYRWLEDTRDSAVVRWFHAQQDYTRSVLDRIPGRARMAARIGELSGAVQTVGQVWMGGDRIFYLERRPGEDVARLYVRDGPGAPERLLVDPEERGQPGAAPWAIDYFAPSRDGRYVAYGISQGGSEQGVLRVVDATSGRILPDSITRAPYAGVSWAPDGRSFFYNRLRALAPDAPVAERDRNSRAFLHALGRSDSTDTPFLGIGVSPGLGIAEDDFPYVVTFPGSDWAFAELLHGVTFELTVYAAPVADVLAGTASWRPLVDLADSVTQIAAHGDDVYLMTHAGASRYRVLHTTPRDPDLAHADVVVPESEAVVRAIAAAEDALYVQLLDGGVADLLRLDFGARATPVPVELPYDGAISTFPFAQGLVATGSAPGAMVLLESWTHSPLWYRFDPGTGALRDTGLLPPSPIDFSGITAEDVRIPSWDGTMVPLSIVHPRDVPRDGSNPTLLQGYGAYGISVDPTFLPQYLAWFEQGGVLAVCHGRGGGEFGEAWHQGGRAPTRSNTWRDFIACAEYLVREKWTSPARLAGTSGSAGGILAGMAMDERPDLFRAMVIQVGAVNPIRDLLVGESGPANRTEFGDPTTPDGFRELLAMDPYMHVRDGTAYPATLFTTGFNDPRVDPWDPAKMAARLQAATTSGRPVLLRVDFGAGHGITSTASQSDAIRADGFAFLLWQMGLSAGGRSDRR